MDKTELLDRTRKFAIRVFKLVEKLPKSEAAKVITFQLLKASSSVAANYRAVNNFWLGFIEHLELLKKEKDELSFLIKESDEFVAMFTAP